MKVSAMRNSMRHHHSVGLESKTKSMWSISRGAMASFIAALNTVKDRLRSLLSSLLQVPHGGLVLIFVNTSSRRPFAPVMRTGEVMETSSVPTILLQLSRKVSTAVFLSAALTLGFGSKFQSSFMGPPSGPIPYSDRSSTVCIESSGKSSTRALNP